MPLTPQQFRTGVQNLGGHHIPFDQGDLVDRRVYLDEGACGAFSAIWIRSRKLRALGQQPPDADACMEEVSWIGEQVSKGRAAAVYNEFFAGNGLRQDGMSSWPNGAVDWNRLWFFLSAQQAYYFLGVLGANTGHAIAVDTNAGAFRLFDPNYGTARFPSAQAMKTFFGAYWRRAYPDLVGRGFISRYR